MMKVLHINAVYQHGSTGRFIYELKNSLQPYGVETIIATTRTEEKDNVYVVGNSLDWKLHGLFSRLFGTQGYFSYFSTKKLLRKIDQESPQVIHLHNLHANYIHFPKLMKYVAKKKIPLVLTLHDCWFFTGKCCHYTVDGCDKWQTNCHHCVSLKKYNQSWFFDRTPKMHRDKKKLFGNVSELYVIGVSQWLTNEARKAPVFENAKKIDCIYNWVDTEIFSPKDASALKKELHLEDKKVILSVASIWSAPKGLGKLRELSEHLRDGEQLVVVGRMSEEDRNKFSKKVLCLPPTNSTEELAVLYSMADVLFQPSLEETFGLVVAEAMSCGTPAVCFRSTANPELVNEMTGAVAEDFDVESALNAIRNVLQKGRENYSEECRRFAIENFEKSKNTEQYYQLYEYIKKSI